MKKKLLIFISALALTAAAAGCGQKDNGVDNSAKPQQDVSDNYAQGASDNVDMDKIDGDKLQAENDGSATLEESAVSIEDAKITEVNGQKLFIVSYKFKNKSDNAESFSSLMKSDAYQDGMSINRAIINADIEGFDSNSTAERIEPGKTIIVQEAYLMSSDTAPVEVVVSEFHSESGVNVTKTFNLQ